MLGGWKVEGVSELSDLILQSAAGAGIVSDRLRGRSVELEVGTKHGDAVAHGDVYVEGQVQVQQVQVQVEVRVEVHARVHV